MSTKEVAFSPEDITTIYDALHAHSADQLAQALLGQAPATPHEEGALRSTAVRLATRRVTSMLRTLFCLGSNCEASTTVILPWKPSHLSQLSHMSWPDALGSCIVIPSNTSPKARAAFLANALLSMSYM